MTEIKTIMDDRILVLRDEKMDRTEGGIIVPEMAKQNANGAVVKKVGPGRWSQDGTRRLPMTVKEGDRVLLDTYAKNPVKIDGVEYDLLREGDIVAVL